MNIFLICLINTLFICLLVWICLDLQFRAAVAKTINVKVSDIFNVVATAGQSLPMGANRRRLAGESCAVNYKIRVESKENIASLKKRMVEEFKKDGAFTSAFQKEMLDNKVTTIETGAVTADLSATPTDTAGVFKDDAADAGNAKRGDSRAGNNIGVTIGIALVVVVILMLVLAVGAAIHSHRSATNEKNEKAKKRYKSNDDQIIKIDSESKSTITTANPQHDRSMDRRKGSARIQQVSITDSSNSVHPLTQRTSGSSKDNGSARNNDDKLAPVLTNIYNQHIERTNKYKNPALEVECDKILTL